MKHRILFWRMVLLWSLSLLAPIAYAQGTMADYERASSLRDKFQGLAVNISERATWIDNTSRFWYRKSVKGGNEFVLVDADTLAKRPAFDHEKLAASLSAAAEGRYTAVTLPFTTITFVDNERAIEFAAAGSNWKRNLTDYACKKGSPAPQSRFGQRGRPPEEDPDTYPREYDNDVFDGMVDLSPRGWRPTACDRGIAAKSTMSSLRPRTNFSRNTQRASTPSRETQWTSRSPLSSRSRPRSRS